MSKLNKECPNKERCGTCKVEEARAVVQLIYNCNTTKGDKYGEHRKQRSMVDRRQM